MAETITLEVAVPQRLLVREEVERIQAKAVDGYLGVLPGHAPLMTELGTGVLSYWAAGATRYIAVDCGFMEVLPGRVRVLADRATPAEEVDVARAQQILQQNIDLLQRHDIEVDAAVAQLAIEQARALLDANDRAG